MNTCDHNDRMQALLIDPTYQLYFEKTTSSQFQDKQTGDNQKHLILNENAIKNLFKQRASENQGHQSN